MQTISRRRVLRGMLNGSPVTGGPKTGANTAIPSALFTKFTQVFIVHKDGK